MRRIDIASTALIATDQTRSVNLSAKWSPGQQADGAGGGGAAIALLSCRSPPSSDNPSERQHQQGFEGFIADQVPPNPDSRQPPLSIPQRSSPSPQQLRRWRIPASHFIKQWGNVMPP